MINWLIELLGGFTADQYHLFEKEYDNQREIIVTYRARQERLLNELKTERDERKFLQDIIFKKFGIINSDTYVTTEKDPNLQPVNFGTQRWSNLKNRLERDDAERVKNNG